MKWWSRHGVRRSNTINIMNNVHPNCVLTFSHRATMHCMYSPQWLVCSVDSRLLSESSFHLSLPGYEIGYAKESKQVLWQVSHREIKRATYEETSPYDQSILNSSYDPFTSFLMYCRAFAKKSNDRLLTWDFAHIQILWFWESFEKSKCREVHIRLSWKFWCILIRLAYGQSFTSKFDHLILLQIPSNRSKIK